MNAVTMVGLSHRTAPLPLLERVAVPADRRPEVLAAVRAAGYGEAVLLATCSRTEIYAAGGQAQPERLLWVLAGQAGAAFSTVRRTAEVRTGPDVVDHLFRVTAGLESRVLGEPDIRTQVRAAIREACSTGTSGTVLGELFSAATRTAAAVHRETALGSNGRSLAARAVDLGLAGAHGSPTVLVVGSGRMASAAVQHLRDLGHRPVVLARDERRAAQLAGVAQARPLAELAGRLGTADVVICATSAWEPLIGIEDVHRAMRARARGLVLVDLSVPRNVDPGVAGIEGVRVVDVEGMHEGPAVDAAVVRSVERAEVIVRAAVRRHHEHLAARRAGALIAAMRERVEARCHEAVLDLAPPGCCADELARIAHTVAGRLAHPAIMAARAAAAAGDDAALLTICGALDVELTPQLLGLGRVMPVPQPR